MNLPEMSALWRQVLNLRTKAQMGLPEPALVTGKVIPVVVPPSAALKRFVQSLAARAEAFRSGRVDPTVDNMLRVVADGRKAALDMRLIVPTAPRPRHSKIAALVVTVAQIYHTYSPVRGTQLVFCDLATPKGKGRGEDDPPTRFTDAELEGEPGEKGEEVETAEERTLSNFVYYEIRAGLVTQGIPRDQIAFIHDCTTKAQRDALFAAVNEGRVRVLLGSTGKMSVGMNVQQRLIALHNLDCPWRPGDLEQRHGRILRQGNQWPQVYVFSYITEGSFDSYLYQLIESKARFIEQALAGEITARTVEDTSEIVLSAAEIKAIASGNPQIVCNVQLEAEVARLERVRSVWLDTRRNLQIERHFTEEEICRIEGRRALWERAGVLVAAHPHEPFCAEVVSAINGEGFTPIVNRAEAGAAVRRLLHDYQSAAAFQRRRLRGVAARYRGLNLIVQAHAVFVADLSLALPDGTILDTVNASTDTGVWQSVGHTVSDIPATLRRLGESIAQAQERIVTIERELARLEQWDGQVAYDNAMSELSAINATFAAAEEPADTERGQGAAATLEGASARPSDVPQEGAALADVLLALAQQERAGAGWGEWQPLIPPAPASLAWMAEEVERLAAPCLPCPEHVTAEAEDAEGEPVLAGTVGLSDSSGKARVMFGEAIAQRRVPRTEVNIPANSDAEVHQLPLF